MSWLTVVWSMASAVCLTLAAIHFAIWLKRRRELAHPEEEVFLLPENAFEAKLANRERRWR
jgi:hypothetical protein